MRYRQNDYNLLKMEQQNEILKAQTEIGKSMVSAFKTRKSFLCTKIRINEEMEKYSTDLVNILLKPMFEMGWSPELEPIWALSNDFDSKTEKLKQDLKKTEKMMARVNEQLDKEMPDFNDLEPLTDEDRNNLVKHWSTIESFLDCFQPVYKAFEIKWHTMKVIFRHKVQDLLYQAVKKLKAKIDESQENKENN